MGFFSKCYRNFLKIRLKFSVNFFIRFVKPTEHVRYYNNYETLAIYWPCRCGYSIYWAQLSMINIQEEAYVALVKKYGARRWERSNKKRSKYPTWLHWFLLNPSKCSKELEWALVRRIRSNHKHIYRKLDGQLRCATHGSV